jgi:hypothetical protein
MIDKIIEMLNLSEFYDGDEYIQIAKGKYALPKNLTDIKDKAIRIIKTNK